MEHITLLIGIVIVTALVFDFTNGFHDTANAMATTISTGALKPKTAVAMSAVLNLIGAFLSVEVAKTISSGIIDEGSGIQPEVIFAGLVGAIIWNLLTWLAGLPSSSSHALMGGLIGATVASVGLGAVNGGTVVMKVLIPAVAAPLVAGLAALFATRLTYRAARKADEARPPRATGRGRSPPPRWSPWPTAPTTPRRRWVSSPSRLITGGVVAPQADPPTWVIVSAGLAIALGTYLGGWRIIRTMGRGLTDIKPPQGFAAQTSAAVTILASSHIGFSLSTTHVCSGAVMGSGVGRKGGVVRWSTAARMVMSWGLTLPAAGLVAAGAALLAQQGDLGVTTVAVLAILISGGIWLLSRRQPVDHTNVNDATPEETEEREPAGVVTAALRSVAPPPTAKAHGASEEATAAATVPEQEPQGSDAVTVSDPSGSDRPRAGSALG